MRDSQQPGLSKTAGDQWTLHLGDCLEGMRTLADKSVDVVITDPPYEAEAHTKQRRILDPRKQTLVMAPIESFAAITEEQRAGVAIQIARVTKRWAVVFCQLEAAMTWRGCFENAGARYVRTMIWIKPNGQPQLTGDRPGVGYECMVVVDCSGEPLRWNGGGKRGWIIEPTLANFSRTERMHETQKPQPLMEQLVADFSDEGELVLDPFAGSGTTGVACRQLGRRFLGWELNPEYHAIATRRLRGEEAKPRPEQPSLFDNLTPKAG